MNKLKEKVETLLRNNDRITINGLGFAERAYLLSGLNQKSLLVCVDETEIERTKAQLEGLNKKVLVLTEKLPLLFGMNETANPLFKDYYNDEILLIIKEYALYPFVYNILHSFNNPIFIIFNKCVILMVFDTNYKFLIKKCRKLNN